MKKLLLLAGVFALSGCASDERTEYRTDCNTTDAELQVRIHQIATDLGTKVAAPVRHGEGLAPAIEYDIDIPSAGQLVLKEYAGKITVDIAGNSDANTRHIRDLVEQVLKQNSCEEWTLS